MIYPNLNLIFTSTSLLMLIRGYFKLFINLSVPTNIVDKSMKSV